METVPVELGSRSYTIHIEEQLLDCAGSFIQKLALSENAAIITNMTIAPLYAARLAASLEKAGIKAALITLPDGEKYKTLGQIEHIYSQLLGSGLDRKSFLIALGGGVIGDMTGFAAATFMRGIPFIQIPTTLLAQVDSSVGGKTGVNLKEGKNLAGAFYQPRIVLIDPQVLVTLDPCELRSGLAEVIKTAVIHDAALFKYLEANTPAATAADIPVLKHIIANCCKTKAQITSRDETELGIRAHLNFGHTIGHAIEVLTGFSTYSHGEAVAMGMAAITRLSGKFGYCESSAALRVERLIHLAGLPFELPFFSASDYVDAILKDKKKSAGTVNMVFFKAIGSVFLRAVSAGELFEIMSNMLQKRG